jgi:hypothetical protein
MIIENMSFVTLLNIKIFMGIITGLFISVSVMAFIGCKTVDIPDSQYKSDELRSSLEKLQKLQIYFGHRSVGNNIIQGLNDILKNYQDIRLNIVDMDSSESLPQYYFAHNRIGENGDPNSKCDAFADQLDKNMGSQVDIAFFKYCFADIKETIDIQKAFDHYKKTYSRLKTQYPDIIFIHVTVPLGSGTRGWKRAVKKLFNLDDWSYPSNIKRNEFNNLILATYQEDPIFDLAKFESTYPDGRRESFNQNGKTYYSLIPAYTHDGGHLNETGRKVLARELIQFLSSLKMSIKKN